MAEVLERSGNKVKFKVVVPADEVNSAYAGVYQALARQIRVPGFRPGKAPKSVLEKRVGPDYVLGEVREYLLERAYPKAVRELELSPVSANVTPGELVENAPFEFTVDAETYPEVKLPAWEGVQLEASTPPVEDEHVSGALEELRQRGATYEGVERASAGEDLVNVEITTGEDKGTTYPVYLDRADAHIRDALTGRSAGDEVEVPLNPPAATQDGQTQDGREAPASEAPGATLGVRVLDVKEKRLPELDDEFAKTLGVDDLEALRAAVRADLEARAGQQGLANRKEELTTRLADGLEADVPAALIERRRHAIEHDIEHDLERQGTKLGDYRKYLESEGKLSEFEEDLTKSATTRVRRDLALEALADSLGTKLSDEEWRAALESYARANRTTVAKLRVAMGEEGLANFRVVVTRDKALEEALARLG